MPTQEELDENRRRFRQAAENAKKVLKPGDRIRVAKCPGGKRVITFAGWSGPWIVSKSGIDDYAPYCVDRVNGKPVDFSVPTLQPWEIKSLKEIEKKWYESFYSIIFTPPGEIPQVKGHWTDTDYVVEMLGHLKEEYPAGTPLVVASSRCGDIHVEDADDWLMARQAGMEWAAAEAAYIKAGVCSQCGACSPEEAEKKCRPTPLADTGDYTCEGERLWAEKDDEIPEMEV